MIHGRWSATHGRVKNGHIARPRAIGMLRRKMYEKGFSVTVARKMGHGKMSSYSLKS
jgi:hypothetical protein